MALPLDTLAGASHKVHHGPVIFVVPKLGHRNRLTCAFRPIFAIPHVLLVGAPIAFGLTVGWSAANLDWGATGGALGVVAGVAALIAWFSIIFTGIHPKGLWELGAFYLRWRVRVMAYAALLHDDYPPFGDGEYPAGVDLAQPTGERDRVTTALRVFLLIPHFIVLWLLGVLWLITTMIAWTAILFTGAFPPILYDYGVTVLRWSVRVESYLLLLHDEYPPFSLE